MLWIFWLCLLPLCFLVFTAAWLLQRRIGDAGLVDVFWPYTVAVAALFLALLGPGDDWRRGLMAVLTLIWGGRLGTYILSARILHWGQSSGSSGHGEDRRYAQMRVDWQDRFQVNLFRFYQYQGVSVFGLSIVFLVIALNPAPLGLLGGLGLLTVAVGIAGEWAADRQLQAWRTNPANKGKTCRAGLWAYSRHPNYFFEWLVWLGWAIVALGTPTFGLIGLIPAIVLYVAINYFTGIPPNEEQNLRARGEDYARYQAQVSAFFPWLPKP